MGACSVYFLAARPDRNATNNGFATSERGAAPDLALQEICRSEKRLSGQDSAGRTALDYAVAKG